MATDKAVLEERVRTLEYVLDIIPTDPDDEDAPNNCLANDLEVLRHKTLDEIKAADAAALQTEPSHIPDPDAPWHNIDAVYGVFCDIRAEFDACVAANGGHTPNMDLRAAHVRGLLAAAELAFMDYLTASTKERNDNQ
jgi:hypothetical protein